MKKIKKLVELQQYKFSELSKPYRNLVEKAFDACKGSYSPYSQFPVGAAVLLEDGVIIKGSNQENAAYPSGLCAERTAIFFSSSEYPQLKLRALAVCVENELEDFVFPCGSCLQVMAEYQQKQNQPYDVLIKHPKSDLVLLSKGIDNLLPFTFGKQHLSK